jgi:hypothetical protein
MIARHENASYMFNLSGIFIQNESTPAHAQNVTSQDHKSRERRRATPEQRVSKRRRCVMKGRYTPARAGSRVGGIWPDSVLYRIQYTPIVVPHSEGPGSAASDEKRQGVETV